MRFPLALPILLAACGGDDAHTSPDAAAPTVDAAPAADAPPAVGTITILFMPDTPNTTNTHAGASVSIAGPDGHVTQEMTLDANGAATATIAAGSSVTIAYQANALVTILDVQPGDALVFPGKAIPTAAGSISATGASLLTTMPKYTISAGGALSASNATPSGNLAITSDQLDAAGAYDLVAWATSTVNSVTTPIAYAVAFATQPPATGGPSSVALPMWKSDFDHVVATFTNGANDAKTATVTAAPFDGTRYFAPPESLVATFANHSAGGTLSIPRAAFTSYEVRATIASTNNHSEVLYAEQQAAIAPAAIDLSPETALPFVHDLEITLPEGAREPHFAFVADGSLSNGKYALMLGAYTSAGGTAIRYVVSPSAATTIALPDLGTAQAAFEPSTPFSASSVFVLVSNDAVFADARAYRENWTAILAGVETYTPSLAKPLVLSFWQ